MVEVAANAGGPLGGRRDVRLTAQPGEQPLRQSVIPVDRRASVAAQCGRERWRDPADGGQPLLQQRRDAVGEILQGRAGVQRVLLHREQPGVDQRPQCTGGVLRGGQPFDDAAIDLLQVVQRRLAFGDLDLGGGEPALLGSLRQPAGEERLTGAVLPATALNIAPPPAARSESGAFWGRAAGTATGQ